MNKIKIKIILKTCVYMIMSLDHKSQFIAFLLVSTLKRNTSEIKSKLVFFQKTFNMNPHLLLFVKSKSDKIKRICTRTYSIHPKNKQAKHTCIPKLHLYSSTSTYLAKTSFSNGT